MALSQQTKGVLITILGVLLLSPDTLFIRWVSDLPNLDVVFYRYGLQAVAILLYLLVSTRQDFIQVVKNIGLSGIVVGLCFGTSNLLFTTAIQLTEVANVLVIVTTTSIFASLFSWVLLGEKIPVRTGITILVCIVVIILIFQNQFSAGKGKEDTIGIFCALGSAMTLGMYYVGVDYLTKCVCNSPPPFLV